jgi:hypothetical protein
MGLFSKKITYTATEDDFSVFDGKTDITDDIEIGCWFDTNHMIVYHEESERTILLPDLYTNRDGQAYPAEVLAEHDTLLFRKSEDRTFGLYHHGTEVTERVSFCGIEEDLWFYDPETEQTYRLADFEDTEYEVFIETEHVGTRPTDGFYYRFADGKFRFVYQGAEYSEATEATRSDTDVLLYHPEVDRMFLIKDAATMKAGTWREDQYSVAGDVLFFRKTGDAQFRAYYRGREITSKIGAFKIGSNAVLYFEETNSHYWVDDGWTIETGFYRPATLFAKNSSAVWHADGKEFQIYRKGRRITKEVQLQRVGDNGVAMHEASMSMFQIPNLFTTTDNVLRGIPE